MARSGARFVLREDLDSMASNNESDRRTVVDWRGRKQKQRMFGIIKLIILVAILGAVAGLGIRYYPTIMASLSPAKDSPVPPPPPPKKRPFVPAVNPASSA